VINNIEKMKTNLSKALFEELNRHNQINRYIFEQDAPEDAPIEPAPAADAPPAPSPSDATLGGATPPPAEPGAQPGQPIDVANDPDVEEITGDEGETSSEPTSEEGGTEELDITELVNSQKNIETKQEEYMSSMMSKLDELEQKLSQMDSIFEKINNIEDKIEKYRTKTPEEKLHLRSLDSYPFNQKLTDFFGEKSDEMEKTGKNEYVLKPEDVEDVDHREIRKTFDQGIGK
jgi:hypothetical protein